MLIPRRSLLKYLGRVLKNDFFFFLSHSFVNQEIMGGISDDELLIPELLSSAGYRSEEHSLPFLLLYYVEKRAGQAHSP